MNDWERTVSELQRISAPDDVKSATADQLIVDLVHILHSRVAALETARGAQPPAPDDEIVEALAQTSIDVIPGIKEWSRQSDVFRSATISRCVSQLRFLRALGYDVVKRS